MRKSESTKIEDNLVDGGTLFFKTMSVVDILHLSREVNNRLTYAITEPFVSKYFRRKGNFEASNLSLVPIPDIFVPVLIKIHNLPIAIDVVVPLWELLPLIRHEATKIITVLYKEFIMLGSVFSTNSLSENGKNKFGETVNTAQEHCEKSGMLLFDHEVELSCCVTKDAITLLHEIFGFVAKAHIANVPGFRYSQDNPRTWAMSEPIVSSMSVPPWALSTGNRGAGVNFDDINDHPIVLLVRLRSAMNLGTTLKDMVDFFGQEKAAHISATVTALVNHHVIDMNKDTGQARVAVRGIFPNFF